MATIGRVALLGLALWLAPACVAPAPGDGAPADLATSKAAPDAWPACDMAATAPNNTLVYDGYPRFYTRSGWVYGNHIATLAADSTFRVCESAEIGFFGNTKEWLRIRFPVHAQDSEAPPRENLTYGWVYSGQVEEIGLVTHATEPPEGNLPSSNCGEAGLTQASASQDLVIYGDRPRLYTGTGWVFGEEVGVLPAGVTVFECEVVDIDPIPGRETLWTRLAFFTDEWKSGWVRLDELHTQQ